jgi:hypothetical protein
MLVCNWLHSAGQNHFHVMMLLYRDSVFFRSLLRQSYASRRFCTDFKTEKSDPLHPSERLAIKSRCSTIQASSVWTTRTFCLNLPLCQEASNCSKLYVRTSQQHVWTPFSVRLAMGFLSKTQIWEDNCNRPDDVCSCPDDLLHKASCAYKVQPSGRHSS